MLKGAVAGENKTVELLLDGTYGKYVAGYWVKLTQVFDLKDTDIRHYQIDEGNLPILDVFRAELKEGATYEI